MSESDPLDASVRLALPREARAIAAVQRRGWQQAADLTSARLLEAIGEAEMTEVWETAILRPPLATFRVLVAVEAQQVVGFATTMPSDDPDADESSDLLVAEFLIDPQHRSLGHGSRLLNAVVDVARADGFSRATWWVGSTDDALRAFLTSCGWAPDGSHREIGSEDAVIRIKQVRLHTAID